MVDNEAPVKELECVRVLPLAAPNSSDGRYRFRHDAIEIRIEHDDDVWVASDGFSTVYGTGEDERGAIDDYVTEMFAYFDKLDQREAELARGLRTELATLRRYIEPVR